jgi:hypothetical protein
MSFKERMKIIDSPANCDLFLREYKLEAADKDELHEFHLKVSSLNGRFNMDAYVSLAQAEKDRRSSNEDREINLKENQKTRNIAWVSIVISVFALGVTVFKEFFKN